MLNFYEKWFEHHAYIPVGVPANYIEKIIVGDKITPEQIKEIKQQVMESGLNLKVYNTFGELL